MRGMSRSKVERNKEAAFRQVSCKFSVLDPASFQTQPILSLYVRSATTAIVGSS